MILFRWSAHGGTCFPKDINSLFNQMKKSKVKSFIVKAAKERNEKHDRPSKDWEKNKGRAKLRLT